MVEPIDKIKSLMAKALSPGAEDSEEGARCALFAVKLMKKYGFTVVLETELGALKRGMVANPAGDYRDLWADAYSRSQARSWEGQWAEDFIEAMRRRGVDQDARHRAAENLHNAAPGGAMFNGWAKIRARAAERCVSCNRNIASKSVFWWGPTSKKARCVWCGPSTQVGDAG